MFFIQILIMAAMRYINPITLMVSVFPAVIAGFFIKMKGATIGIAVATGAVEAVAIYVLYKDSFQRESSAIAAFIAGFVSNALIIFLIRRLRNRSHAASP